MISAPVVRAPVISSLSAKQQQASERTHRHRTDTSRNNAPIPGSDDSSQDDEDSLFDDQLLPPDKNRITRLRKEIKRIKSGVYPTGYEKDRTRAIKEAEEKRLEGKPVPAYLTGVKTPWSSGMGQANGHYDEHQIAKR